MKKEYRTRVGNIEIEALPEDRGFKVKTPETLSRDDLIHLRLALQEIIDREYEELLEERRVKGQKTYVEYRGDQIVAEY